MRSNVVVRACLHCKKNFVLQKWKRFITTHIYICGWQWPLVAVVVITAEKEEVRVVVSSLDHSFLFRTDTFSDKQAQSQSWSLFLVGSAIIISILLYSKLLLDVQAAHTASKWTLA